MNGVLNKINIPELNNPDLAYETGIHIGDGSMGLYGKYSYQYFIYGNNKNERLFFKKILIPLISRIYGIKIKLKNHENTCFIQIYSKQLVEFKSKALSLPKGPKDKIIKIPEFIKLQGIMGISNFIAGLFDTDGQFKIIKRNYPRLQISLKKIDILKEVKQLLNDIFKISSTLYKNDYYASRVSKTERRWFLEINGKNNVKKFLESIPIKNPKYIERLNKISLN